MADPVSVEECVRRLEDLEAIQRLFVDYGRYLDAKDFVSCSELWSVAGEFVVPFESVRGPAGVLDLFEGMLGEHLALETGQEFHVFTNPTVDLDGDRATARSMWLYVTPDDEGHPRVAQLGHYEDEMIREGRTGGSSSGGARYATLVCLAAASPERSANSRNRQRS